MFHNPLDAEEAVSKHACESFGLGLDGKVTIPSEPLPVQGRLLVDFQQFGKEKKHFNHCCFSPQTDDSPSPKKSRMLCCKRCILNSLLLF